MLMAINGKISESWVDSAPVPATMLRRWLSRWRVSADSSVAVEELRLSYHSSETMSFTLSLSLSTYIYIYPYCGVSQFQFLNSSAA